MTNDEIARLRALETAATPGEWFPIYTEDEDDDGNRIIAGIGYQSVHEAAAEPVLLLPGVDAEPRDDDTMAADCTVACAARNALPALLDEVERLRAEVERYWTGWIGANQEYLNVANERDAARAEVERLRRIEAAARAVWEAPNASNEELEAFVALRAALGEGER